MCNWNSTSGKANLIILLLCIWPQVNDIIHSKFKDYIIPYTAGNFRINSSVAVKLPPVHKLQELISSCMISQSINFCFLLLCEKDHRKHMTWVHGHCLPPNGRVVICLPCH